MHPRPAGNAVLFLIISTLIIFLSACGSNETAVTSVYPRILVAYESTDAEPVVYLSLFGEVNGDAMRLESMTITHKESGLLWSTDLLETIDGLNGHETYIGYSTFRPYEKTFPAGGYTVTWYERNGRHFSVDFSLTAQSLELPQKEETVFTVMVEDQDHRILYAGQQSNDFLSADLVLAKYPDAWTYRKYVLKSNTRVMYVYPPVFVRNNAENEY